MSAPTKEEDFDNWARGERERINREIAARCGTFDLHKVDAFFTFAFKFTIINLVVGIPLVTLEMLFLAWAGKI